MPYLFLNSSLVLFNTYTEMMKSGVFFSPIDGARGLGRTDLFRIFWDSKRAAQSTAALLSVERNEIAKKDLWV
jgi:hypothetical protein